MARFCILYKRNVSGNAKKKAILEIIVPSEGITMSFLQIAGAVLLGLLVLIYSGCSF
jgi:hypothetical protein